MFRKSIGFKKEKQLPSVFNVSNTQQMYCPVSGRKGGRLIK